MFRPKLLLGVFLIALAIMSYLSNPGWRTPFGVLTLFVILILGFGAVAMDLATFWRNLRK